MGTVCTLVVFLLIFKGYSYFKYSVLFQPVINLITGCFSFGIYRKNENSLSFYLFFSVYFSDFFYFFEKNDLVQSFPVQWFYEFLGISKLSIVEHSIFFYAQKSPLVQWIFPFKKQKKTPKSPIEQVLYLSRKFSLFFIFVAHFHIFLSFFLTNFHKHSEEKSSLLFIFFFNFNTFLSFYLFNLKISNYLPPYKGDNIFPRLSFKS